MSDNDYAIRRIVAGHNAKGLATIIMDGTATNQQIRKLGHIST